MIWMTLGYPAKGITGDDMDDIGVAEGVIPYIHDILYCMYMS